MHRVYRSPGGSTGRRHRASRWKSKPTRSSESVARREPENRDRCCCRLLAGIEETNPTACVITYAGRPAWTHTHLRQARRMASYPRPGYVMPVFQDPFRQPRPTLADMAHHYRTAHRLGAAITVKGAAASACPGHCSRAVRHGAHVDEDGPTRRTLRRAMSAHRSNPARCRRSTGTDRGRRADRPPRRHHRRHP